MWVSPDATPQVLLLTEASKKEQEDSNSLVKDLEKYKAELIVARQELEIAVKNIRSKDRIAFGDAAKLRTFKKADGEIQRVKTSEKALLNKLSDLKKRIADLEIKKKRPLKSLEILAPTSGRIERIHFLPDKVQSPSGLFRQGQTIVEIRKSSAHQK